MLEWTAITAILGIGLIYNMSQVYRIPAAPGWNTWRTNVGFMISALLLGISVMAPLLAYESSMTGIEMPASQWMAIGGSLLVLLFAQLIIMHKSSFSIRLSFIRIGLIFLGMMMSVIALLPSNLDVNWIHSLIFLIIASEEVSGEMVILSIAYVVEFYAKGSTSLN